MPAFRIYSQIVYSIIIDGAAFFQRSGSTRQLYDFGLVDIICMEDDYCVVMIYYGQLICLLKYLQYATQLAAKMLRLDAR
jgi:hypothetical protein